MEDFSPPTVSKNVSFIKITPIEVFVEKHMEKFRAEKLQNRIFEREMCCPRFYGQDHCVGGGALLNVNTFKKGFPVFE